ncbi:phosphocarrier protein HPr [Bacilli bacterium]|nr:phosphocarrier protein HPr [Bacilli bacterium]
MKSIKVKVIDPLGLHARPASKITSEAGKYKSTITISVRGNAANAKSLINLMALGVKVNDEIEIKTDGLDASEALTAIQKIMTDYKII